MTGTYEQHPLLSAPAGRSASLSPELQGREHLASFERGFPSVLDDGELISIDAAAALSGETLKGSTNSLQLTAPDTRNGILTWFKQVSSYCAIPFTLLMSAIGAGTLSIPYTFLLLSPTSAFIVLVVVGTAMAFTADIILRVHVAVACKSSEAEMKETYQELAVRAGGTKLARFVAFTTAFAVFGACVGSVRVVKDMAPTILSFAYAFSSTAFEDMPMETQDTLVLRTVWLVFLLVALPLGTLKNISALRYSSYLSFTFVLYLVAAVTYRAITLPNDLPEKGNVHPEESPSGVHFAEVFGIYNFTFMMHLNVIPLLAQLVAQRWNETHSQSGLQSLFHTASSSGLLDIAFNSDFHQAGRRMRYYVYAAAFVCILLYGSFGYCAASIYGSATKGNILLNLDDDAIMTIPCVALFGSILLSFPLLFHPLKELMLEIRCRNVSTTELRRQAFGWKHRMGQWMAQAAVAFLLLATQVLCALHVPGVEFVFSFVGSTALLLLCYILPTVYYWKLYPWRHSAWDSRRLLTLVILSIVTLIFALISDFQLVLS